MSDMALNAVLLIVLLFAVIRMNRGAGFG
jgi:hypothetical protein